MSFTQFCEGSMSQLRNPLLYSTWFSLRRWLFRCSVLWRWVGSVSRAYRPLDVRAHASLRRWDPVTHGRSIHFLQDDGAPQHLSKLPELEVYVYLNCQMAMIFPTPNDAVRMRGIPFFFGSVPRVKGCTDFVRCPTYLVKMLEYRSTPKGDCRSTAPHPQIKILKSTDFVETGWYQTFYLTYPSRNQLLKSTDC